MRKKKYEQHEDVREGKLKKNIQNFIIELSLLILSAFLFSLSFPNYLSNWGLFPLAFIAIVPVFIVVHRASWIKIFFYGMFYGFASYFIFNFWLISWHPLGVVVVPNIYAFYFFILFPVLKLIDTLFPGYAFILQSFAWIGYEYLRIQGFLGYCYGVLGYSQYPFIPFIQVADLAGIWGVTFLVIFPSAFLGNGLKKGLKGLLQFLKDKKVVSVVYIVIFILNIVYGFLSEVDLKDTRKWKVALIQQNIDPWLGGYTAYENSLKICKDISLEALKEGPEIVIWSETSFVPSILWYSKYQTDLKKWELVRDLRDFLDKQTVSYVIGNNDADKRRLLTGMGKEIRVDYNATLLYRDKEIIDKYRKLHLVPFGEHFPFRGILNWLYELLQKANIHYYEKGTEYTVFEDRGVKFSTPICFEDAFGYLNRDFVLEGADVLVNITNDSWAFSLVSEIQHMSMAVFRAVENKRSLVRSANGGITCIVDPNGHITNMIEPFQAGYLVGDVPVYNKSTTLYTLWGDWFAYFSILVVLSGIIWGIIRYIIFKKPIDKDEEV